MLDRDGIFTYVSPSVERVLGHPPESVLGRSLGDLMHPHDRAELWTSWRRMVDTPNASMTSQGRYRHADGSWRWLETISRNLLHEPGVGAVVSNAREVTRPANCTTGCATRRPTTGSPARQPPPVHPAARRRDGRPPRHRRADRDPADRLDEFKTINDTLGHRSGTPC
jgi:PAS domain S-box-containing protein